MTRTLLAGVIISIPLFLFAPLADAALPSPADPFGAASACVKASFKGAASTYNPNYAGWKTGGQTLATGGTYNPNEYEAALQLDLAKRYRCGYGGGAVCHAVVQAPNGRAMTVRINDNGPLTAGRVIDLNEKSMQYLSGGTMGRNSGIIKDVTVTLLCGIQGVRLGPLDPAEREAWASRTFDAPYANVGGSPFASVSPFNTSASGGYYSGASYQSQSVPLSSSVANPYGSYGTSPSPASYQPASYPQPSPISAAIQPVLILPEAIITVQPARISRGSLAVISWSSVGMSASSPCKATVLSGTTRFLVGQGNEGTRQIKIDKNSSLGTLSFTLRCTSRAGAALERSASLFVQ